MWRLKVGASLLALTVIGNPAYAGLYYSRETIADLPSQWRGFLLDHRALRQIAIKPTAARPATSLRIKYEEARARLEKAQQQRKLTADEQADLGALYVRLGDAAKAIQLLRAAQHEHPKHFHIVANLGTAWQLQGDWDQAAACLREAVELAPGKLQKAEEYQLKLVLQRRREGRETQKLDDLFGVQFVGESGKYEPGKLAEAQSKKLPSEAAALAQRLALWLPADGRLLWQLAELANAHGDFKTAAAIMDGCVTEFGLHAPDLRQHRQAVRAAADELAKSAPADPAALKVAHEGHAGSLRPRSKRPLVTKLDESTLPPINIHGVTPLPWGVLSETTVGRPFKPVFPHYLKELEGHEISLSGFIQPLGEDLELERFMLIENPVGCWYCEMPELSGIVVVELPAGKSATYTRALVKITGMLTLNAKDPEKFLYTVEKAKVTGAD
jgi:Tfp pilus assembly protein PilF